MDEIKSYKAEPKDVNHDADGQYIITFKEEKDADAFVNLMNDNAESIGVQGVIFSNARGLGGLSWVFHYDIYRVIDNMAIVYD